MPTHSTGALRLTASLCAFSLIIASAGFGAVFAWTVAKEHSYALAILTVMFAVALEGLKPLAIAYSLSAFQSYSIVRGVALLLLGVAAITYSLTSEIALVAGTKEDLAATRQNEGDNSDASRTKYDQALAELKLIMPSRLVPEVEAEILRSTDPKRIAKLRGEIARTQQRERLQSIVANYKPGLHRQADPGASALATYLRAVGYTIEVPALSQWLALVPVLALELSSALSVLLVQAIGPRRTTVVQLEASWSQPLQTSPLALPKPLDSLSTAIVDHVRTNGGSLRTTERALAEALASDKTSVRRAIHSLTQSGLVAMAATKTGTVLKLAA
jgi:uncharacterized membrane protein